MIKIIFSWILLLIFTSCVQNNNDEDKSIKNWNNVPRCSDLSEEEVRITQCSK